MAKAKAGSASKNKTKRKAAARSKSGNGTGSQGERIKALRLSRGLTRKELAKTVGGTEQWLYLLEIDRVKLLPKRIPALCSALTVGPEELTGEQGAKVSLVPASRVDIVSKAVIDAAVTRFDLTRSERNAFFQFLNLTARRAKTDIGM
jgi:transcriptional regulator with XRE-family HTH domain